MRTTTTTTTTTATTKLTATALLLLAMLSLCAASGNGRRRDACIVGGGAAGANMALELIERGYERVRIIERFASLGGNCDTVYGPDGTWNEPGVAVYPDTVFANALGLGPWKIDMVSWVKRFAGEDAILPTFFEGIPAFAGDLNLGLFLGAAAAPPLSPQQVADSARLFELMNTTYRWMETLEDIPNPIPAALTVSLNEFIAVNNFTSLLPIFYNVLYYAGFGDFDNLTAFDGLMQRTPTDLLFGVPDAWFSVKGGCQRIYDGMLAHFDSLTEGDDDDDDDNDNDDAQGEKIVRLNATITQITRPLSRFSNRPVVITGTQNGVPFTDRCNQLILTPGLTLGNLGPILNLSPAETAIYSQISTRNYFIGTMDITTKPGGVGSNYTFANVDIFNPTFLPSYPGVSISYRKFDVGPAVFQGFAAGEMDTATMRAIVVAQLDRWALGGAVANYTITRFFRHAYNPHFDRDYLALPWAPHNKIKAIQGLRKTWVVGASLGTPNTMLVKNQVIDVADLGFPPKVARRASLASVTSSPVVSPLDFASANPYRYPMPALPVPAV